MTDHQHERQTIERTHNTARFFVETRHVAWVLLVGTMLWGVYGYLQMPQRKDPDIPIRQALVLCAWPGASAERIEQLVTKRIEEEVAGNVNVEKIESNTRTGVTAVYVTLVPRLRDTGKEFDDIKLKLDTIDDLPDGAGPIVFIKDFGDTAALMLTVASPQLGDAELALRGAAIRSAINSARSEAGASNASRVAIVHGLPASIPPDVVRRPIRLFVEQASADGMLHDARTIEGAGFVGVDAATDRDDATLQAYMERFVQERLRASEFHPDAWPGIVIRDPAFAEQRLAAAAGDKYSYRELDEFTDLVTRTLKGLPMVSKVTRTGLLQERVFLEYSQERLAAYGVKVGTLDQILSDRNITVPGGMLEVGDKQLTVDASGEFKSEREVGNVLVPALNGGSVYLRDIVSIGRGYDSPPRFLNFYGHRTEDGSWRRARAITLAVQMRSGA